MVVKSEWSWVDGMVVLMVDMTVVSTVDMRVA